MGRVLVTGATGFLGGHVVARLRAEGRAVSATGRAPDKCRLLSEAGFDVIPLDLSQKHGEGWHALPSDIDAIIHCAALSAPFGPLADFVSANVTATANLVAFARQRGVRRFVHISTPSVYFAFRDQEQVAETATLPKPVNHYARTKGEAERLVLDAPEISPIILRPRAIYGANDTALLPRMIRAAEQRALPLMRGGGAIDLTHVDDAVDAVMAALNAPDTIRGEIYNVSDGDMLPIRSIIEAASARAGIQPRWRKVPFGAALTAAAALEAAAALWPGGREPVATRYSVGVLAYRQSLNISKIATELGWTPKVSFEEGLRRTFEGTRT